MEIFLFFRINALLCRTGVFGLVCCCLAMLVSVFRDLQRVVLGKLNLKEQFIGYTNFYRTLSLAIIVISLFVASG